MDEMYLAEDIEHDDFSYQSEHDPEALFDVLTRKSLRGRYGDTVLPGSDHDELSQNEAEAEFENYVLQFPIDDAIAECFAFTSDSDSSRAGAKFLSGAKRPPKTTYHKLKKKLGWGVGEDPGGSDDDGRSSQSKRSRNGGGVFGRRQKWANKKSVNFSDQSNLETADDVNGDSIYLNMSLRPETEKSRRSNRSAKGENYYLNHGADEWPPLECETEYANIEHETEDAFDAILTPDIPTLLKNLEDLSSDVAARLRDNHGNTLLHRSVVSGNAGAVKVILEMFPDMGSDLNDDKMTAIEVAAMTGQESCLKVMLERNRKCKALGPSLINRLLHVCAQHGKAGCLGSVLQFMPKDTATSVMLPGDARGNTAAHAAARNGHLQCLHALVSAGFDVTSENLVGQRPLHLSNQNRRHDCFEYLLLLDICEGLLRNSQQQDRHFRRLASQMSAVRSTIDQLNSYLQKYQALFKETRGALTESKEGVLDSLTTLYTDLVKLTTKLPDREQRIAREKLDDLNAEIERLQDTFEFSPLSNLDSSLTRLFDALNDVISGEDAATNGESPGLVPLDPSFEGETKSAMGLIIQCVHEEMARENLNTTATIRDILSQVASSAKTSTPSSSQSTPTPPSRATGDRHNSSPEAANLRGREPVDSCSNGTGVKAGNKKDVKQEAGVQAPSSSHVTNVRAERSPDEPILHRASPIHIARPEPSVRAVKPTPRTSLLSKSARNDVTGAAPVVQHINKPTELPPPPTTTSVTQTRPVPDDVDEALASPCDRIDRLISGLDRFEKERSQVSSTLSSDSETLVTLEDIASTCASNSVYTTTLTSITSGTCTSGVTSELTSESNSRFGTSSCDSTHTDDVTSESASNWWEVPEVNVPYGHAHAYRSVDLDSEDDYSTYIHLDLENEHMTDEELRRHRLAKHLRAVEQFHSRSNQFTERITSRTGETIGGIQEISPGESDRIVVNVSGALRSRNDGKPAIKPRKKQKTKLFSMDDVTDSKSMSVARFLESYDRSRDPDTSAMGMRWEDMNFSDEDQETTPGGKPWYDMSDDELSFVPSLRSEEGDDTEDSRTPRCV